MLTAPNWSKIGSSAQAVEHDKHLCAIMASRGSIRPDDRESDGPVHSTRHLAFAFSPPEVYLRARRGGDLFHHLLFEREALRGRISI